MAVSVIVAPPDTEDRTPFARRDGGAVRQGSGKEANRDRPCRIRRVTLIFDNQIVILRDNRSTRDLGRVEEVPAAGQRADARAGKGREHVIERHLSALRCCPLGPEPQ